ncbi:MAG: Tetratricopeptide repeat protein [Nitrospira sp.]|nr:tetratricopeptide repeat protein [Nitrospira sp.]ULA58932.1 MAG: Tetratricopeptide repeat protein [Nitrospira sp.]
MKHFGWMVMVIVTIVGCAGQRKAEIRPLHAPAGTTEAVSQQLEQGNQLLLKQEWAGARDAYLATIQADQSLAEAHYNLALALEKLGEKAEARKHYVAAANLAPGNKVIWDAPPLRKYDSELTLGKKSWMDANPK